MKKSVSAIFAAAAMSASLACAEIVVGDVWSDSQGEDLAQLSLYDTVNMGVIAYDDADDPAILKYSWKLVSYPEEGEPEVYDLADYEAISEFDFIPATMSGIGTFDVGCVISGDGLPATTSIWWRVTVYEAVARDPVEVSTVEQLQQALNSVKAGHPLEIHVVAGTYKINDTLRVWSGTTILADPGAVFAYMAADDRPILRGGHFDETGSRCYDNSESGCLHGGYGQCHDVVIRGGTWNRNSPTTANSNAFVFRHSSGIELSDLTVAKCCNHFVNLSGSENVLVSNVIFKSAIQYDGDDPGFWGVFEPGDPSRYKTLEALHLDALTTEGEPGVWPLDGTPCRNVQVVDCTFAGVFAGVGTHHLAQGMVPETTRAEGIEIRGCTFSGLQSFAVYCFGYEGAVIADNTVTGGAGLANVADATCEVTGNSATGGNHNMIQVSNGSSATIVSNALKNAGMAAVRAISASTVFADDNTITTPLAKGLSAAEGSFLSASGNTITGAKEHGIFVNAATAELTGNSIVSPGEVGIRGDANAEITATSNTITGPGTHGISVGGASKITATGNTITGAKQHGIFVNAATADLKSNKIVSPVQVGIRGDAKAVITATSNAITGPGTHGISLSGASKITANGNTITGAKQHGIYVKASSASLKSNKIVSPAQVGIRGDAKSAISAGSNAISGAGTYGISLSGASKLVAASNTVQSPKKYGIFLESCAASTISKNTVTGAGSVGIRINKTKGCTISGNTVTTTAAGCDGILLDTCATGTVSGNKVTKTGAFGIRILGTKAVPATVAVTGNTVATGASAKGYADIKLGDWCRKCKVTGNYLVNGKFAVSSVGTKANAYAPAATTLVSVVRKAGTAMAVTWKKQKYAAGYQVQWADNKSFKVATTANVAKPATVGKAIGSLNKKKSYWVRVRTFDKVSGVVSYSDWSPAMVVLP